MDDERVFLEMVAELFSLWSKKTWQIHCVMSADQALEVLRTQKIDLVVVDVNMPVLDGLQLLRILNRRYPDIKKAVITALASEEKRADCLANGAELFIEKPRSADGLKSVFAMLNELIAWTPREGFHGVLRRVGLQDVIQMECLGRNSSVLEVHNTQVRGRIYIEDGRIVHAAVGGDTGEIAFQKLLALSSGEFHLQPFELPPQRTIDGQWEFLLMEAARVRDEVASNPPAAAPDDELEKILSATPEKEPPQILETLICSLQGATLYTANCPNFNSRVTLLRQIALQVEELDKAIPLGDFERLELQMPGHHVITQIKPDRMVFVRVAEEKVKNPEARRK
ncbi:MAG TPA: response regulator [Verrucomicrobiae bacterium]|nr:response regulator [Verrucomicrobiae bacterium]